MLAFPRGHDWSLYRGKPAPIEKQRAPPTVPVPCADESTLVQEQIMKDRKSSSSGRQQGDTGRQNQWQQSQESNRQDRPSKGSSKSHGQQNSTHRTQQR